jgi:Tat protein translocase TatB subunit
MNEVATRPRSALFSDRCGASSQTTAPVADAGGNRETYAEGVLANLGWEEILVIAVIGLIVFGPDRLPKAIRDASQMLRQLRTMARGAATDLKAELGPELADFDLRSLNPRRFVEDAIFGDDDPPTGGSAVPVALGVNERPPYDSDAT